MSLTRERNNRCLNAVPFLPLSLALGIIPFMPNGAAQSVKTNPTGQKTAIVQTDLVCLFSIDGQSPYKDEPSAPTILRLPRGEHAITAVSLDGQDLWRGTFKVDRDGVNVTISLLPAKAERSRKKSEAAALRLQVARVKQEVEKTKKRNAAYIAETNAMTQLNSPEGRRKRAEADRRRAAVAESISKWEINYDVFLKSAGIYQSSGQSITATAATNPPTTTGSIAQLIEYGAAAGQQSKAAKELLGARATMKLIVHATNWIGASYQADDLDKLWAQGDPTVLRIYGPGGLGRLTMSNSPCFAFDQESPENKSKDYPIERLSFNSSEIKGIHPPGLLLIRNIRDLNDGTKFVLVTTRGKYEFQAMSKEDRADVF